MNKSVRKTSAMLCAITVMASSMSIGGFVASAREPAPTSDYTITIPATLSVANKGWNALEGGISAKGTLECGKKLVVTPTSENSWNLVANKGEETESKVGYNLAKETGTYSAAAEAPKWEFTELTADGTSQTAGIIVDDYSEKPAGTYQDFVTFTATVEEAAIRLTSETTALTTGTYFVPENDFVDIQNLVTVSGDVTLKIEKSANVLLDYGLSIDEDATLNVQVGESGQLNIYGTLSGTGSTVAGDHGTLVLTSGNVFIQGGTGESGRDGSGGANGGTALNGSVIVEGGIVYVSGGIGGNGGVINDSQSTGGKGGAGISGDMTVTGGGVEIFGGPGGFTCDNGLGNTGGNGGAAIEGSLTVNGGAAGIYRGNNGEIGEGSENCTAGTGGDGYNGTLTLGEGITLFDQDFEPLDEEYSSRVYQGEKKPMMYALVGGE